MTGRKWQMVKLDAGDWLLRSNSGRALIRFRRYYEDGSLGGDAPIRGHFWEVQRREMPASFGFSDWWLEDMETWDSLLPSRAAAIQAARSLIEDDRPDSCVDGRE